MRVLVAFGTRPEIIKLGPVYRALASRKDVQMFTLWTGQHVGLADGLLDLFGIKVDFQLDDVVNEPGLAGKFGLMTQQTEAILRKHQFDWIVVQGDTMTAAAVATTGFLNRVPVAHVEAGLRTGDLYSPFPEEFNRKAVTLCSTLHFAPTFQARVNLLTEGVAPDKVLTVGNTVVDALLYARGRIASGFPVGNGVLALPDKKLVLATLHRRENIGAPMRNILMALRDIALDDDKVIALPVHLNPQVESVVHEIIGGVPNIHLLPPLQYPDFVYLLNRAWVVVSDSGGVQEEAPTFGLPVLITRDTTERPEVVVAGFGSLVGANREAITSGVRRFTSGDRRVILPGVNPFGDGDSAKKIAAALLRRNIRLAA